MNRLIPRTCTCLTPSGERDDRSEKQIAISDLRDVPAFVLLGDPGMGKSTTFEEEAAVLGDGAELFTARDFLTFDIAARPGVQRKIVFIDALDEMRSGTGDPRGPLDQIRAKLERMGNPRFRISCRPADWLGNNDRENLAKVSPDSILAVYCLDPLTKSDAEILLPRLGVQEPREFMLEARQRNVHGLLGNPQTLEMLAKCTAGGGDWPSGQRELFERACRQSAVERNSDHRVASGRPAVLELLDAAGFLCSMLLICGRAHISSGAGSGSDSELPLDDCDREPRDLIRSSLATNLFRIVGENEFEPAHRRVAEFLGGRYLAGLISGGHPPRRILALMTGNDGGIASSLRGLAAWLATLSPLARTELIQRDPVGVAAYGDLKEFANGEKSKLIGLLSGELSSLIAATHQRFAFGSLVSPDTEMAVCEILDAQNPGAAANVTAKFILDLVPDSPLLPNLESHLLRLIAPGPWSGSVRESALKAYLRNVPDSPRKTSILKRLLQNLVAGQLPDSLGELRGILLSELYPREVSASDIWDHITDGEHAIVFGDYWQFWERILISKSSPRDLATILDEFHSRVEQLVPNLSSRGLLSIRTRWLAEGLRAAGDSTDPVRLHNWLSTGLNSAYPEAVSNEEDRLYIKNWLEQRPRIQLAISSECLRSWPSRNGSYRNFHGYGLCLRGSRPPPNYGLWCLSQIADYAGSEPQKALMLLEIAFDKYSDQGTKSEVTVEDLRRHSADHGYLSSALDRLLVESRIDAAAGSSRNNAPQPPNQGTTRDPGKTAWLDQLRNRVEVLRANNGDPHDLYILGREAIGLFEMNSAPGPPRNRLAELLDHDEALTNAAYLAIRGAPFRGDVSNVTETLRRRKQSKISKLDFAILVGLQEIEKSDPETLDKLSNRQLRNVLAVYLCVPTGSNSDPRWFKSMLANRTDIVADVFCQFFTAELNNRADPLNLAFFLAHRSEYAELARMVCIRLLKAFPVRCNLAQTRVLDQLLQAAFQHADPMEFDGIVSSKLARKSILPAPKTRFLAAAAILDPDKWLQPLKEFLDADRKHVNHLVDFLGSDHALNVVNARVTVPLAKAFAELIGREFGPYSDSGWVGREQASGVVGQCIRILRTNPQEIATLALTELSTNPDLGDWDYAIELASSEQKVLSRDASYEHPTTTEVSASLRGCLPANVADLAGLIDDQLSTLGVRIRNENTNDWRQFWDEGRGEEDPTPKHEDYCRDAILSDLRLLLPSGVTAEREGHYANDGRADMKVYYDNYHLPVEIKKHFHRDLWTSPEEQLIAKYASDPATEGHGIFLALWFGREFQFSTLPSTGTLPESADELAERLSSQLPASHSRKILVRVIDVSRPNNR